MSSRNKILEELLKIYDPSEAAAILHLIEEAWNDNILQDTPESHDILIQRLKAHTPIQYILNRSYFYDAFILLNGHTLIPRPETEELVHWVLNDHHDISCPIWDIGTGSGCIAITLARKNFNRIIATDINPLALGNLQLNTSHYSLNIASLIHDILSDSDLELFKNIEIIVSNPPYIDNTEKDLMSANVLNHEPHNALFPLCGDPLIFYKKIAQISNHLSHLKYIYLEINPLFEKETVSLFEPTEWEVIVKKDMQGLARMMKCVRIAREF